MRWPRGSRHPTWAPSGCATRRRALLHGSARRTPTHTARAWTRGLGRPSTAAAGGDSSLVPFGGSLITLGAARRRLVGELTRLFAKLRRLEGWPSSALVTVEVLLGDAVEAIPMWVPRASKAASMDPAELGARLTLVARRGVDETALGRLGAFLSQPATSAMGSGASSCATCGERSSVDVAPPLPPGRRSASARTATAAARRRLAARPASACSPAFIGSIASATHQPLQPLQQPLPPAPALREARCDPAATGYCGHEVPGGVLGCQLGWAQQPAELRLTSRPGSSTHTGRSRQGLPVHYDLGALEPSGELTTYVLPLCTARQADTPAALRAAVAELYYARSGERLEAASIAIEYELEADHHTDQGPRLSACHAEASDLSSTGHSAADGAAGQEGVHAGPKLLPSPEGDVEPRIGPLDESVVALRVTALPVHRPW